MKPSKRELEFEALEDEYNLSGSELSLYEWLEEKRDNDFRYEDDFNERNFI